MTKICLVALLATAVSACAMFQPTTPAVKPSDYTVGGVTQGITLKDSSIHYDPAVLKVGMQREQVLAAFGDPNSSRTTDNGVIEDVYAFNPDGSKFVDPQLRVRNVALGFFTMGASVAVRQARLALTERKLTLFHVFYTPSDTIKSVTPERLAGAPETLPTAVQPGGQ
jgi:hypothetical protein